MDAEPLIPPAKHGGRKRSIDVREVLKHQWVAVLRHCLAIGGGTFDFRQENISDGDVAARFSVGELLEETQEGQS